MKNYIDRNNLINIKTILTLILTFIFANTYSQKILSEAEIKTNAEKHSRLGSINATHFYSIYWDDETSMKQKTIEVVDLIKNGWRGLEFAYFIEGLEIKGYTELKNKIEVAAIDNYTFTNPMPSEMESGDYETKTVNGFAKPLYYKRKELYPFNEEGCIKALVDFYSCCGGNTKRIKEETKLNRDITLRNDFKEYVKSEEFNNRKILVMR